MGTGWRRLKERIAQGSPLGATKDFQPTSNARCSTMLEEAKQFLVQLEKCEGALRKIDAANNAAVATIRGAMAAPLPRCFQDTAAGSGGAAAGPAAIGGDAFSANAAARAMQEASHKTEAEVLAPLQGWKDVYSQISTRFGELERQRLELDSRRRTVAELSHKVDSLRSQLSVKGSDAKHESALQQSMRRLQHKESKLQVASQSYADTEQLLHRDLSTLIADARWLRHYVATGLRVQGTALVGAADAFGPLPLAPSPPARNLAEAPGGIPGALGPIVAGGTPPTTPDVRPPPLARFPVTAEKAFGGEGD